MKRRKALLICNLGTPDKPEKKEVRRFLSEFLNDRRVIDIPWLAQKILVNFIIIPFRVSKSTILYKKLWTESGSPLLLYLNKLVTKLQQKVSGEYDVFGIMRYGNPSLSKTMNEIKLTNYDELIIFPLFPQYASSTTGSIIEKVLDVIKSWEVVPGIKFIEQFYNHPEGSSGHSLHRHQASSKKPCAQGRLYLPAHL